MNINLLEIYEDNKKIEKEEKELEEKKELRKLISAIVGNEERFSTNNKTLVENLKKYEVKITKSKYSSYNYTYGFSLCSCQKDYNILLSKANIKKIQEYIGDFIW